MRLMELVFDCLIKGKLRINIEYNNFDTNCGLDGIHEEYTKLEGTSFSFGVSHKGPFVFVNHEDQTCKERFKKCITWLCEFLCMKAFSIIPFDSEDPNFR